MFKLIVFLESIDFNLKWVKYLIVLKRFYLIYKLKELKY